MTVRQRVEAVLRGEQPDRPPFLDRLEVWHRCHTRAGTLPARYAGFDLPAIYADVGLGWHKFVVPYALRLRGVTVEVEFEGGVVLREREPVVENFPGMWDYIAADKPGITVTTLSTPVGTLTLRHEVLPEMVRMGVEPYLREHLIKDVADYIIVEWIVERAEFVPRYAEVEAARREVGEGGYVAPLLHRIPFQQVLLEYLGEAPLFYALCDDRPRIERLLQLLDGQMLAIIDALRDFDGLFVEFPDNLTGTMTNPRLFRQFCLGAYQRYVERLHGQGRVVGSHTDGDVRQLLGLLKESTLDVCESFSPWPLTSCRFEEAWAAWQGGPRIWGGIPSPLLEVDTTDDAAFVAEIDRLLAIVGDSPIIFGIGDLVLGNNSVDRVRHIAERLNSEGPPRATPEAIKDGPISDYGNASNF
jgi:hypothetical protein